MVGGVEGEVGEEDVGVGGRVEAGSEVAGVDRSGGDCDREGWSAAEYLTGERKEWDEVAVRRHRKHHYVAVAAHCDRVFKVQKVDR